MEKAKIVVLAGQSNAVGVGHVEYLPRHFDEKTIEKFKSGYENVLINYYSHDKKSGGFVKTAVGCTEVLKDTLGPEVGIAQTLSEKYSDETVYIVKCAFGGTNIFHDWLPPSCAGDYDVAAFGDGDEKDEHYRTAGWCYNELVSILKESISYLEGKQLVPEICAFCWMQGESDADTEEHVSKYGERYKTMLGVFAAAFGKYIKECVYIDGGISEIWPLYSQINECKKQHAANNENSYFIDTISNGLTTKNEPYPEVDTAHYDSDCTVKLGNLFAEKITL